MFGSNPNNSFGNFNPVSQNSPFGQSAFGKPASTTAFGTGTNTPVFGGNTSLFNSKPAGTNGGGLFGQTNMTLAFGGTTTAQSFGGFGSSMTNAPMFGQQQNANTSLFPSNNVSAFGQPNKTTFGFGQTANTSLFGHTQQPNQQTTPFGQSTAASGPNLFGSAFGGAGTISTITGTAVKFQPLTGTDTMVKSGTTQTITTRHHCITCMKEYENKSLEELRLEDYSVGRKGPVQSQTATAGASASIFGAATQNSPFGTATSSTVSSTAGFGTTTSAFGAQTSNLFAKPVTGFGAPQTTTSSAFSFNNAGTSNTSSLFSNQQNKPFGAATGTSLFGTGTTQTTPGNVFGGLNTAGTQNSTLGFNSSLQNQNIGLFSQNKPVFNTPAATSASGFGGFGQSQSVTNTSSLFGSKPAGTGFGTTATNAGFGVATTGFGTAQNNNTSLFTSSFKPATQANSFGVFGNTGTGVASTLGGTGSLALGSNAGAPLFQSVSKPSLFNNSGVSGAFQSSTFSTGSSAGFGLGGTTVFGAAVPTLGMSLGAGSGLQQNQASVPVHQQILALVSAPFGDSPLLKNLLPASGKTDQLLNQPANSSSIAKNACSSLYKVASSGKNINTIVKPKMIASATQVSKKSIFEGLEDESPLIEAFQPRPNVKRLVLRPKPVNQADLSASRDELYLEDTSIVLPVTPVGANSTTNKENKSLDLYTNEEGDRRSSWLISALPRRNLDELRNQSNPFSETQEDHHRFEDTQIENSRIQCTSVTEQQLPTVVDATPTASDKNVEQLLNISMQDFNATETFNDSVISLDEYQHYPCRVKLRRSGYYTIPTLVELNENFTCNNTCVVPHFTIGRQGYGNVYFSESFDVFGLNLDDIVHFRHKEIIIYPDDNVKPSVGKGLNRKAQVTLDRVWPLDKLTHEPITEPQRLAEIDYEGKLRRVSAKHGTKFLEYRPETGSWVFKVDHFSKYGLNDSDDEDEGEILGDQEKKNQEVYKKEKNKRQALKEAKQQPPQKNRLLQNNDATLDIFTPIQIQQESPSSLQQRLLMGTSSYDLQLMKASFFDMNDEGQNLELDISQPLPKILNDNHLDVSNTLNMLEKRLYNQSIGQHQYIQKKTSLIPEKQTSGKRPEKTLKVIKALPPPTVRPKSVVLRYNTEMGPYQKSRVNDIRGRSLADTGIYRGRSFRVGFGPNLTFVSYGSKIETQFTYDHLRPSTCQVTGSDPTSMTILQRMQVCAGKTEDNYFQGDVEAHLCLQLSASFFRDNGKVSNHDADQVPTLLRLHRELGEKIADFDGFNPSTRYFYDVWKLCECLWGEVFQQGEHARLIARKQALSDWFQTIISASTENPLKQSDNDKVVLSLVSNHRLEEASENSRQVGNYTAALLISQFHGTSACCELVRRQIQLWLNTGVSDCISIDHLKLFMLFAGIPAIEQNELSVNVCEDMDWKKVFAIYFWYLCSPMSSLTDVLETYEEALESSNIAEPHPEYTKRNYELQVSGERRINDMVYNLIKLFCYGNFPMDAVLNPQTYTHDPLDYKLCWFLMRCLTGLGYTHVSPEAAALIHINFAAQLETSDLWQWSVFVLQHLDHEGRRRKATMDLLVRHVEIDGCRDYLQREAFLVRELKIPTKWINRAKAMKSYGAGRFGKAAYFYAVAECWNKSHEIISRHLVADAMISDNYGYVKTLLEMLPTGSASMISEWANQGQLILDYMKITEEIGNLLGRGDQDLGYDLERLSPKLTSLCSKINLFPCATVKHKLCQAEIAKTIFQLAKRLFGLHQKDNQESREILIGLISELPLPEDYAQQELRPIINVCVNEMVKDF